MLKYSTKMKPVDHSMYFAVFTYRYVIRSRHPKEVFPNKKASSVLLVNLDQNIGLEKKSNYRKYWLFSRANIGCFK